MTDISFNSFDIMALGSTNVDTQTLTQLLFQTGYLTIGERDEKNSIPAYRLVYPNKEVQLSFETDLASVYMGKTIIEINTISSNLQNAAYEGKVDEMIAVLKSVFASIPYAIQLKYEKYYQSLLYLVFRMCGMSIIAEDMTNNGRIDATLQVGDYIYIIECKIDKNATEAMNQINNMEYAQRYYSEKMNGSKIIKIGMNFCSAEGVRNINEVKYEC